MENIELNSTVNASYEKAFKSFNEINNLQIKDYKVNHILGFFCKKFKDQYKKDYTFKYNTTAFSKCFEVFQVKKLSQIISSDPEILISYINWVFDNKVPGLKNGFRSISFLNTEKFIYEFKNKYLNNTLTVKTAQNITIYRSDNLPTSYKNILNVIKEFNTYGDLAFYYLIYNSGNMQEDKKIQFEECLNKLKELSFNVESLERVK